MFASDIWDVMYNRQERTPNFLVGHAGLRLLAPCVRKGLLLIAHVEMVTLSEYDVTYDTIPDTIDDPIYDMITHLSYCGELPFHFLSARAVGSDCQLHYN